jgi:hypothetical protein
MARSSSSVAKCLKLATVAFFVRKWCHGCPLSSSAARLSRTSVGVTTAVSEKRSASPMIHRMTEI